MIININIYIYLYIHTFVCIPKTNTFFVFCFLLCHPPSSLQDDGQMQRVQIFQALPVLLLVLLTLASNFAKDGAIGRWNRRWVVETRGVSGKMCWEWGKEISKSYVWYIMYYIYTHVQTWYVDILYLTLVTSAYTGFWHPTSCWMVAWAINPLRVFQ